MNVIIAKHNDRIDHDRFGPRIECSLESLAAIAQAL
jgi:hypothetical protein